MGGRSRAVNQDRWDWVKELSDSRLDNYGRMSIASNRNDNVSRSHDRRESLNYWLAQEYSNRKGSEPSWKIKQ